MLISDDDKSYKKLMEFLVMKCNRLHFTLPQYSKTRISPSQYMVNYFDEDGMDQFEAYKKRIDPILKQLTKTVISISQDFFTVTSCSSYVNWNYLVELEPSMLKPLLSKRSLADWVYPEAPEDLCFFIDDQCYLSSIAHEGIFNIHTENREELNILKNEIGLDF